jgi:hypothetical protein
MGVFAGTVSVVDFFSPENRQKILAESASGLGNEAGGQA